LSCSGTFSGKAVLLEDVIYNLSANSDHYKNATLSFAAQAAIRAVPREAHHLRQSSPRATLHVRSTNSVHS